jgi:glyceraldehyde-3-phosphate dehydrogenase (NAD(P))
MVIKVAVNGFGAIGKRVAHAVSLQKDMKLVGIANRSANINVRSMLSRQGPLHGTDLYSDPENTEKIEASGFRVKGSLEDLLEKVDVIVDGTPPGIEAKLKPTYEKHGVKQIYQGGAEASIAEKSFTAIANYDQCSGKDSLRVVSCNTTSLVRTIVSISSLGIKDVLAFLVRRAADPPDDMNKGPINSIIPVKKIPSHHGPDVKTVLPKIDITTIACLVPVTLDHVHFVTVSLSKDTTREKVIETFK